MCKKPVNPFPAVRRRGFTAMALVFAICSGCREEPAATAPAEISEPLTGSAGTDSDVPQSNEMPGRAGRTDAAGKFTLLATSGNPGATVGEYKILVRELERQGFDGGPNAVREEKDKAMMDRMTGKSPPPKFVVPRVYPGATKTILSATFTDDPEKNSFALDVKSSPR